MSSTFDDSGFGRALAAVPTANDAGIAAGASQAAALARRDVPVSDKNHTHLRDTIDHTRTGQATYEISAGDGLPDARAVFVELGTRAMPAQPYLLPAVTDDATFQAIVGAMRKALL